MYHLEKNNRFWKWLFISILIVYLLFMTKLILFKEVPFHKLGETRTRSLNLIPFHTIDEFIKGEMAQGWINELGNILLFVPLGMLLCIFQKQDCLWKSVVYAMCVSIIYECLQYIFMLGVADIDDVLLNTLGGFLGSVLYHSSAVIEPHARRRKYLAIFLIVSGIGVFITLLLVDPDWLKLWGK
ncbi:MAG: VanZ family protein [Christensenellaceae bacterium]|jgi:glycopeptide antibiotics resistance protein